MNTLEDATKRNSLKKRNSQTEDSLLYWIKHTNKSRSINRERWSMFLKHTIPQLQQQPLMVEGKKHHSLPQEFPQSSIQAAPPQVIQGQESLLLQQQPQQQQLQLQQPQQQQQQQQQLLLLQQQQQQQLIQQQYNRRQTTTTLPSIHSLFPFLKNK